MHTDGLSSIFRTEGFTGLFRGTTLGLVGVSNGAVQFMVYEKMKKWGFDQKRRKYEKAGLEWNIEADKLVCLVIPHFIYASNLSLVKHGIYLHVNRQ
jgi:hypothetical protein